MQQLRNSLLQAWHCVQAYIKQMGNMAGPRISVTDKATWLDPDPV